ncbi:MAG: hypothetical protein ACR2FY_14830 [Pirellulaceae bacterium]
MFRFSIRELMLVTLVVALGISWYAEHWQLNAALKELKTSENYWANEIKLIEYELGRQGLEIKQNCFLGPSIQKTSSDRLSANQN